MRLRDEWNSTNIGTLRTYSSLRDTAPQAILTFMDALFEGICRAAVAYQNHWKTETIIAYRERNLVAIVMPVVAALCESYGSELRVGRNGAHAVTAGSLDLWCVFRGIGLISEWKHGFAAYRTGRWNKDARRKWASAWAQVASVDNLQIGTRGDWRASIMTVTSYVSSEKPELKHPEDDDTDAAVDEYVKHVFSRQIGANYVGIWRPAEVLRRAFEWERREIYPYFSLCAYLERC